MNQAAEFHPYVGNNGAAAEHTYIQRTASGEAVLNLPYRLLRPDPIDRKTKYPIVLYLHGAGSRAKDNHEQLDNLLAILCRPEYRQKYHCFVIAPQCPYGETWTSQIDTVVGILDSDRRVKTDR